MSPIRTYEVRVPGFPPVLYSSRTPGKARAKAWHSYSLCEDISFGAFLSKSSIRRVPDPPGIGERILVGGEPATRCIGHGQYVWFMRDDSDALLCSHPNDVTPAQADPHMDGMR